ncbi:transposase, partial [Rhodovulum sulfidophilum]|uniref:transposase n=1 Tax=Rhodovulum sulfidophilum TaxID=35806 RepID=UPI00096574BC
MARPTLLGHRKKTGSDHDKAPERRGVPGIRADPGIRLRAVPGEMRWHRQRFPDSAAGLCPTLKMPFDPPLRQTARLGKSHALQRMAGRDWRVPDRSIPCRRQPRSFVDISHGGVGKQPHIVGDSPGIGRRLTGLRGLPICLATAFSACWRFCHGPGVAIGYAAALAQQRDNRRATCHLGSDAWRLAPVGICRGRRLGLVGPKRRSGNEADGDVPGRG